MLHLKPQLNFPHTNHIIQGLAPRITHKISIVILRCVMIYRLLYLLIHNLLRNQKSPLVKLGGNLRHSVSSLAKILELPHQLFLPRSMVQNSSMNLITNSSKFMATTSADPKYRPTSSHQSRALYLRRQDANITFAPSWQKLIC